MPLLHLVDSSSSPEPLAVRQRLQHGCRPARQVARARPASGEDPISYRRCTPHRAAQMGREPGDFSVGERRVSGHHQSRRTLSTTDTFQATSSFVDRLPQ